MKCVNLIFILQNYTYLVDEMYTGKIKSTWLWKSIKLYDATLLSGKLLVS